MGRSKLWFYLETNQTSELIIAPPPPRHIGITLSICSSVRVSDRVRSVSPEQLNLFWPNLVWWCIILGRCVVRKNWFTIFYVKVTVRADIIKIRLSSLYFLNCWSVGNQTWFCSTVSKAGVPVEKLDYCSQGQGHSEGSKCQWMFVWTIACKMLILL